jgi:hypothetical protein
MKLSAEDRQAIWRALDMHYAGGIAPQTYPEWRRFERLRKARVLRYWKRKSVRWDRTFYDVTDSGVKALQLPGREIVVLL